MKRIIKNHSTITEVHMALIAEHYPEGVTPDNLVSISTVDGKRIHCLEIKGEEVVYLFRFDNALIAMLDEYTDDEFDLEEFSEDEDDDFN
ncbi:MAG: hypothetical protein ACPF83_12570 [Flavobacteriales bacterium]